MNYSQHYIINSNELYVIDQGYGDPILFLHGGPGLFHDYLAESFRQLSSEYRLIFFDQRGSGNSHPIDPESGITINDFISDIEALRKVLELPSFTIIGHSWGGLLAVLYARQYGQYLKSMILIDPAPGSSDLDKSGREKLQQRLTGEDRTEIRSIMESNPFQSGDIKAISRLIQISEKPRYYNQSFVENKKTTITFEKIMKLQTISSLLEKELDNYDIYNELRNIDTRTLIIHGDFDPIPIESSRKYSVLLDNARLEIIENCGHFPFEEKNQETITLIKDFIESL